MSAHTPGKWSWWTSCSWRRLRSDLGHGNTTDVLMPTVHRDGQADIIVSDSDMAVIVAAPKMLETLRVIAAITFDKTVREHANFAIAVAEGRS